jgi:hypothetical protein
MKTIKAPPQPSSSFSAAAIVGNQTPPPPPPRRRRRRRFRASFSSFNFLLLLFVLGMLLPVQAQDETVVSSCTATACTSPDGAGGFDCWAGSAIEPCTCSSGEARPTGETQWFFGTLYHEYRCCTNASIAGITGEQCGVYQMRQDASNCAQDFCTSPDLFGLRDCWAGSTVEPCTCSGGRLAKVTGDTTWFLGTKYYEYTCCSDGSGTGEKCGAFSGAARAVAVSRAVLAILLIATVAFAQW